MLAGKLLIMKLYLRNKEMQQTLRIIVSIHYDAGNRANDIYP